MTDFDELLNLDPLLLAEKITGKSYKEDAATGALGLAFAREVNERKRDELALRDDTYYGSDFNDALRIVTELGFVEALSEDFVNKSGETEVFKIFWRAGVLLTIESYTSMKSQRGVNTLRIYYNWTHDVDLYDRYDYTSSGRYNIVAYDAGEHIWVGDHDGRIALRHILAKLEANGNFLEKWIERPWLWLIHYMDKNDSYDREYYKSINAQRISQLPQYVQDAITP